MKRIFVIFQRELLSLLATPSAWVFLTIYVIVCGLFTFVLSDILAMGQAELSPFFNWIPWIFMFVIPALGMSLWTEERRTGTLDVVLSYPATIMQFVIGKYLAGLTLLLIALLLTISIPITILLLGEPDIGAILCGYFGAFIVGSVFLAVSCFCSALSKSQTASYLLSLGICAALVFSGWDRVAELLTLYLPEFACKLISYCAVIPHYQSFQRGILDSSEVFYGLVMTGVFLYFTRAVLVYTVSGAGSIFTRGTLSDSYTWKQIGIMLSTFIIGIYGFFCITYFSSTFHTVLDCTEDRAFSLSPLSQSIAENLDKNITIRFYTSPSGGNMPKEYQLYSSRIKWLLQRFTEAADGRIRLQIIQPEQDSTDEEAALTEGIHTIQNPNGDRFYLGLSVSYNAQTAALPFLSPRKENLLEYELIRAIDRVTGSKRKFIGVVSAFPVLGRKANPATGQQPSARWTVFEEIAKDYHLVEIPLDYPEIPEELDAVLVFHPQGISNKTLYALDQYLVNGGNLGVFLDPDSSYARANIRRDYGMLDKQSSDLGPLPDAWGISYNKNILPADMLFKLDRIASNGTRQIIPTVLNIDQRGINREIPYLSGLSAIRVNFTGAFPLLREVSGLSYQQLLHTTEQAKLVSVNDAPEKVFADFQNKTEKDPDYKAYPLAWRISGLFPSAYPNGAPDAGAMLTRPHKAKAENKGEVFLFGDTDMLFHDACITVHTDEFNQQELLRSNDNLTLFQNIIDELTQSPQLAELRSRIPMNRPLTKVNESKLKADLKYKDQILALGMDFNHMQKQMEMLNKYMIANGNQQKLTPEQQNLWNNYKRKQAEFARASKEIRLQLKTELDALSNRVRMINILYVPLGIIIIGLCWAVIRRLQHGRRERS